MRITIPLLAQFALFWTTVAVLDGAGVTLLAWAALYALSACAFSVMLAGPWTGTARRWLAIVFYSLFFAACFYFANVGLDVLHGAGRPKADVARHLGGLEFWFFLCPGVTAFAVAGLVHALLTAGWQQRGA